MKQIIITTILFMILSCSGTGGNKIDNNNSSKIGSQDFTTDVPMVDFDELKKIIESNKEKLLVVNFWATWCKPCIEELPEFLKVNDKYKDNPDYKMILISLDQTDNMEGIKRFLQKIGVDTEVYLLNDNKRMNIWIPETDASWSGSIPATVFYKKSEKIYFHEGKMEKQKLDSTISNNYKL